MYESESVTRLQADAPFPLLAPGILPEGYTVDSAGLIAERLAQIKYVGPQGKITYRMAAGADDISGDYNQYAETVEENMGAYAVTRKGGGGMVSLCVWVDGEGTYALSFDQPATPETAKAIIQSIAPVQKE